MLNAVLIKKHISKVYEYCLNIKLLSFIIKWIIYMALASMSIGLGRNQIKITTFNRINLI